jgi:hypothetical protein
VSLALDDLVWVLREMTPATLFVIGTTSDLLGGDLLGGDLLGGDLLGGGSPQLPAGTTGATSAHTA